MKDSHPPDKPKSSSGPRPIFVLLAAITTLSFSLVLTPPVFAAPPVVPLPGEDFLTPAERKFALGSMTPVERAEMGHLFRDDSPELVVAYVRREFMMVENDDGTHSPVPAGSAVEGPSGRLSVPSHATAGCCVSGGKSGTEHWLSFTVTRTRTTAPHEWKLYGNAQWSGYDGSWSPQGMDCCNNDDDALAFAWGNGMAAWSHASNGRYLSYCSGEPSRIAVALSDVAANLGTSHAFREWWDPDNCPMMWVSVTQYIRKNTYSNKLTNATLKYFHTWSNHNWNISFGLGPSISISPTSGQWSLPLYVTFNS